jgi:hypothetical protein
MRLPAPNPDVIYKPVDDGAVLLSVRDEVYYGLNAIGGYIWEHLPPVFATLDELVAGLTALYPAVPAETITADVRELLEDLLNNGLVRPVADSDDGADATHFGEARQAAPRGLG